MTRHGGSANFRAEFGRREGTGGAFSKATQIREDRPEAIRFAIDWRKTGDSSEREDRLHRGRNHRLRFVINGYFARRIRGRSRDPAVDTAVHCSDGQLPA